VKQCRSRLLRSHRKWRSMKRRLTGGITLLSDVLCRECAQREVVVWVSHAGIGDIFWPETPKIY